MEVVHKPSLSNLPLQVALHYNTLYSVMYLVIQGAISLHKAIFFEKYLGIVLLALFLIMEPFRIYFGMKGNLKETVPDSATFLLITLFPQTAIVAYMAYFQPFMFPADYISGTILLLFLLFEFVMGIVSIKTLIAAQTAQFMRLCEEEY